MVAPAHIKIGKKALEKTSIYSDFKIYKSLYLFGCIAPDINFVYPLHNIMCTPERFKKRIRRMSKIKSKLIRSFTLGVIMHYLCDYFCIAHNNHSYGANHTMYERRMAYKLTHDILHPEITDDELVSCWELALENFENGHRDIFDDLAESHETLCNDIFDMVKYMNNAYVEKINDLDIPKWFNSEVQMNIDISWALFMCEQISYFVTGDGWKSCGLSKC